jgi:hypothetical protein
VLIQAFPFWRYVQRSVSASLDSDALIGTSCRLRQLWQAAVLVQNRLHARSDKVTVL